MPFEIHSTGRGLFWRCPVCGVGGIGTVDSVPKAEAAGAKHVCAKPVGPKGTSHHKVLMDCLVAWANLGTEMREIALPEGHYLQLAHEITTAVGVDLRTTRIGVSFTFHGPTGPVTVRNADARLNDDHAMHKAPGTLYKYGHEDFSKGIRSLDLRPDHSAAHLDVDLLCDDA